MGVQTRMLAQPTPPDDGPGDETTSSTGETGQVAGAVLVVEDDTALAALVTEALEAEGHRVAVATDGAAALRLARAGRPVCILLDLHLPVMDGSAFLRAYRAQRTTRADGGVPDRDAHAAAPTPVILFTALSGAEAAAEAERLGAAGFLTKPYELDTLTALVGRFASDA